MKAVIVGDIHGQVEVVEDALKLLDKGYHVHFMGDFLDSFHRSKEDQITSLRLVVDAINAEWNVSSNLGNHERSYTYEELCSGWSSHTQSLVDAFGRDRINNALVDYIWLEGFLISHAGVSNKLLTCLGIDLRTYLEDGLFGDVGHARGGPAAYGGLYWCDWYREFEPIPGVDQIVGHSGYRPFGANIGIINEGNNWNVDCLENDMGDGRKCRDVLVIENGSASRFSLSALLA